jgi:hypothetical protein
VARFHATNVPVKDHHDVVHAITGGGPTPIPSRVSFDVRWHGHGAHRHIRDKTFGFEGNYVTGKATIAFAASHDGHGVIFKSSSVGQHNPSVKQGGSGPPAIGQERNGVFFR